MFLNCSEEKIKNPTYCGSPRFVLIYIWGEGGQGASGETREICIQQKYQQLKKEAQRKVKKFPIKPFLSILACNIFFQVF